MALKRKTERQGRASTLSLFCRRPKGARNQQGASNWTRLRCAWKRSPPCPLLRQVRVVLVPRRRGGSVSRRGVPRDFPLVARLRLWLLRLSEPEIIPYSATGGHSHYADGGEIERERKSGPPQNMKKRDSSWAHCFMTFHLDLSLDEATDSVGIPVFLSVGLLGPVVAFRRACAAPRGSCLSIVRPSGRPKPHLPQNT